MPCHTCMILRDDLNNMSLNSDNIILRTHKNMQKIIKEDREKDFSLHSTKNAF